MENKSLDDKIIPVHWFKSITENGKLATKGFVAIEDFRRTIDKLKPIEVKNVIFNPPATIVLWNDGTKTVVKAENEVFDKEKGLAMAICKRTNGNSGRYFEVFKKYCRKEDQSDPVVDAAFENLKKHIDATVEKYKKRVDIVLEKQETVSEETTAEKE